MKSPESSNRSAAGGARQRSKAWNSWQESFRARFTPRLGRRASGFKSIFDHLELRARAHPGLVLVETGCMRRRAGLPSLDWAGAGCSTKLFDSFAAAILAQVISIDFNQRHCAFARKHCPHIRVICGESVQTLYSLRMQLTMIDLLYLDSLDVNWQHPHRSALHHLNEICAAMPLLHAGALVFVDDNRAQAGKGMYIRQFMKSIGAKQVCDAYQIGFEMP